MLDLVMNGPIVSKHSHLIMCDLFLVIVKQNILHCKADMQFSVDLVSGLFIFNLSVVLLANHS